MFSLLFSNNLRTFHSTLHFVLFLVLLPTMRVDVHLWLSLLCDSINEGGEDVMNRDDALELALLSTDHKHAVDLPTCHEHYHMANGLMFATRDYVWPLLIRCCLENNNNKSKVNILPTLPSLSLFTALTATQTMNEGLTLLLAALRMACKYSPTERPSRLK